MAQGVKERLIAFLKNEGLSQAKFERICGFSNGYVNNIRNGIGADKLQTILCKFPALNANWLVNGEGEMSAPSQRAGEHSVVIGNHNHHSSIDIDNRQYYSDSPDVLRAQIELLDERIKEKDAQIKEKDAQIKEKDAQIKEKDAQIKEKDAQIKEKDAQINRLLSILEKQ